MLERLRAGLNGGRDEKDPPSEEDGRLLERFQERGQRLKVLRERLEKQARQIETLEANLSGALAAEGPAVFFLVGQAKSGTSWLMRLLDAHPEVLCRGEGRIFGRGLKREDILAADSKTLQPSSLYRAILDAEYLNAWIERSVWTRDEDKQEHLEGLTRAATDRFLSAKLARSGKRIVGDKTPFVGEEVMAEMGRIYPEARVIHIVRDGRDVAVSSVHHLWNRPLGGGGYEELTPGEAARRAAYRADPEATLADGGGIFAEERLRGYAGEWRARVARARVDGPRLFGDRYLEIRYEDLLADTVGEARGVFGFLGADAGKETARRCAESVSFERWTKGRERGQEDSAAFLRKGIAGDWRNAFTARDKEIFKEEAGDLLVELGYEEDDRW